VGGTSNNTSRTIAIDSAGKLYVTGWAVTSMSTDFGVIRLLPNGILDNTFGTGGKAIVDIGTNSRDEPTSMALDSAGDVFVAGTTDENFYQQFAVLKLTHAGARDFGFGVNGVALVDNPTMSNDGCCGIALDSGGSIYLAGTTVIDTQQQMKIAKLTPGGGVASFGSDGYTTAVFRNSSNAVGLIPDISGDVYVVAGVSTSTPSFNVDMALVDFNSGGNLNVGFHSGGASYADINYIDLPSAIVRDGNGNFYIVGETEAGITISLGIAKFDKNGSLVAAFGTNGVEAISLPSYREVLGTGAALDSDGNLYVVGGTVGTGGIVTALMMVDGQTGALMPGFGNGNGFVTVDFGNDVYTGESVVLDPARQRVCVSAERGDLQTPAQFAVGCFQSSPANEIFSSAFE
jgi:uncharacterized delta-60 repeat protein